MANVLLTFPEGRHKVVTLSYDDGVAADRRLLELLNAGGLKGTFHINAGLCGKGKRLRTEELVGAYRGHEIAAHTLTHPTIARCPQEQLVEEIVADRKALESLTGQPVRGLSYPNGSHNARIRETLPYLGVDYARTTMSHGTFAIPDEWMAWHPTCHHNDRLAERTEQFLALDKRQHLYMLYVWGHSYEFDRDDNWEMIEQFCARIGGHDEIWYATNREIVSYFHAFERLEFAAAMDFVYNPSHASVWLAAGDRTVEAKGGAVTALSG
ncbi:polysaccharide deacetylase family protein [Paenibacillus sp. IB182496]|uniref:Polysaccharide deacetylase family protein n=1 Tax=Paenibacillus sabuli TaxID=2772509 RepID=A0A927GSX2_9BACL|nr:polysaccharide deacetylase family protein [Paenibacillus sabuli]MBD2846736.1 polysaccharide deacetylase family protein [Paenibacillus sabuli]